MLNSPSTSVVAVATTAPGTPASSTRSRRVVPATGRSVPESTTCPTIAVAADAGGVATTWSSPARATMRTTARKRRMRGTLPPALFGALAGPWRLQHAVRRTRGAVAAATRRSPIWENVDVAGRPLHRGQSDANVLSDRRTTCYITGRGPRIASDNRPGCRHERSRGGPGRRRRLPLSGPGRQLGRPPGGHRPDAGRHRLPGVRLGRRGVAESDRWPA